MEDFEKEKEKVAEYVKNYAGKKGYVLNVEHNTFNSIIEGLTRNKIKYKKLYCPCRLITNKEEDRRYICPCLDHEMDIETTGSCHCSLFFKA